MTAKSDRAKQLASDPLFEEAIENVRQFYLSKIEELPLDQKAGADALYDLRKMLFLLRQVKENIVTMIEDGHLEDHKANQGPGFLADVKRLLPSR